MAIKYRMLENQLRELININLNSGINRLPSEAELSHKYKVSRQTVRQALSILLKDGIIEKRHGSGSYITGIDPFGRNNNITILVPDKDTYIYPSLIYEIRKKLTSNGFSLDVLCTHNDFATEYVLLNKLLEHPPRALIVDAIKSAFPNPNVTFYNKLRQKGCNILFIHNRCTPQTNDICISYDNYMGGQLIADAIIKMKHTKIGGIFCSDSLSGHERFSGFLNTAFSNNILLPDSNFLWMTSSDFTDMAYIKKAAQDKLSSCTAIICHNDMIAYEISHILPDACIFSFDGSYIYEHHKSSFYSLYTKPFEFSNLTAETVIKMLKGQPVKSLVVPYHFDTPSDLPRQSF